MSITIDLGWWLAPTVVTLASLFAAAIFSRGDGLPDQYGGGAVIGLLAYSAAIIVSLVSWLIWALLS